MQIFFSLLSAVALRYDEQTRQDATNLDVLLVVLWLLPFLLTACFFTPLPRALAWLASRATKTSRTSRLRTSPIIKTSTSAITNVEPPAATTSVERGKATQAVVAPDKTLGDVELAPAVSLPIPDPLGSDAELLASTVASAALAPPFVTVPAPEKDLSDRVKEFFSISPSTVPPSAVQPPAEPPAAEPQAYAAESHAKDLAA